MVNGPESNAAAATRSGARTWRLMDDLLAIHSRELTEAAARMGTVEDVDCCRRGNPREDGDGTCRACRAVATRESRLRRRRPLAG
jgi:hypothetical protein